MNRLVITCALGCLVAAGGCGQNQKSQEVVRALDSDIVRMYYQDAKDQAVIRQHTIYPYHFRSNSADLTELGLRDLNILAREYGYSGGPVSVRRGDESEALYALRINAVLDELQTRGVDRELVVIENDLPGGDGRTSEDVLKFRENREQRGFADPISTPSS